MVNRIERAKVVPKVDTLERLLAAAGATLSIAPRIDAGADGEQIRDLLRLGPHERLSRGAMETLDELCRRRFRFVLVGDAAARLHGAPVKTHRLEIVAALDHFNLAKLPRILASPLVRDAIVYAEATDSDVWATAEELPWLPAPEMRILDRWIDAPSGFFASIDALLELADPLRRLVLQAVQQEIDVLNVGYRIYRDPERQGLSLPLPPRRYRPRNRSAARGSRTNEQT